MNTSESGPRPGASRVTGAAREVTPDLACVALSLVNLYLFGRPGAADRGWVLIDAGLAWAGDRIARAAADRFGPHSRPAAIVLTHGHFDHVGAVQELADRWAVPVYAHPWELPYLTGRSAYPPPDPAVGGGAMSFLSRLYPRGPIDLGGRVRPLPADGTVPHMPGWRWVHTPGHAPGHVALFREADRTLVAGDAFVTQRQESLLGVLARGPAAVRRPPAYFTCDWEQARRSVEALAALRPELAVTGHGVPIAGEPLRAQLDALARDWDRAAVPAHGRYVSAPATVTADGVRAVPPPVADPQLPVALGLGAAAVAGVALLAAGTRSGPRLRPIAEQVIVVTGASSGIGLATAELAAARGAKVVAAARSGGALNDLVARVTAVGGQALAVECDVTDRGQVDRLAAAAVARFGRIDTWVNNAGTGLWGRLDETPEADARALFEVNFWGLVHGCRAALPHLRRQGGALINVGSEVSDAASPLQGIYVASKHAVKGYTDSLRVELEQVDAAPVAVTLIQPGATDTPFPQHARNVTDREPKLPTPMDTPEHVAEAILAAAETPTREKKVSGSAALNATLAKVAGGLADVLAGRRVPDLQTDEPPRHPAGALRQSGEAAGTAGLRRGTGGR